MVDHWSRWNETMEPKYTKSDEADEDILEAPME